MFDAVDDMSARSSRSELVNATVKKKLAALISDVVQAPIVSIPTFALINYFSLGFYQFLMTTALCILFSAIIPIVIIGLWSHRRNSDPDLPDKEERYVPLLIVLALYLLGAAVLYFYGAPHLSTALMFCYFSNTLIVLIITVFWKISIHSMGVSGPTMALIFAFGPPGALPGLILPFVMWSRVYLKKHTISQVLMGALLGFMLTAVQMYIVNKSNGLTTDVYSIIWLICAFIAPALILVIAGLINKKYGHNGRITKMADFIVLASIAAILITVFFIYAPFGIAMTFIVISLIYIGITLCLGNIFL